MPPLRASLSLLLLLLSPSMASGQGGTITVTREVVGVTPVSVAVGMEDVNHEIYGGIYSQMVFGEAFAEEERAPGISSMWRATGSGGRYALIRERPFKGVQSQRIKGVTGAWTGIENQGLNRQGLHVRGGCAYEGKLALRASGTTSVRVSLQRADGYILAARTLVATAGEWQVHGFELKPSTTDDHARLAIEIQSPGSLDVGYVLLEPGAWGRFRGLPVRADVAEQLARQGVQAIRFGGCANSGCGDVSEYRWKAMIGDPVLRPVTRGFWYPHESNGFGIFEFLQLGEALGIEAVPSLDIDEKPWDVRDLMEYLYGSVDGRWGALRAADGHPEPYRQKRLQLGNENAVDEVYYRKFAGLAEVIWAYDPTIRLVVGDFTYAEVIADPFDFRGGGKVASLAGHRRILDLAARFGAEVDFDVHIWTETTKGIAKQLEALDSYAAALARLAPAGSKHKIVVFELNADSHDMTRALGNAYAITALQQRPYIDVISSANALQVDGQNDNGWDQGLVFMDQAQVWVQPPWHIHRMISDAQRREVLRTRLEGVDGEWVQAAAFRDVRGTSLHLVNASDTALDLSLRFGAAEAGKAGRTETLGPERPRAVNTARNSSNVVPSRGSVQLDAEGRTRWVMPPRSFATVQLDAATIR